MKISEGDIKNVCEDLEKYLLLTINHSFAFWLLRILSDYLERAIARYESGAFND